MMVDTSAIVAIAFNEPDAETYEQKVVDAPRRFISAATILELSIVIEARLGEAGAAELDLW
ncbi:MULTISPECIES: type II toxin-antitoxin system VapC family toxin, partial [unclassified Ensifer]